MRSSPTDVLVDVLLPAMGTSITEGTLIGWSKAVGDAVAVDETLCEVSTDKVDTECPSPAAGVLAEVLVAPGETVAVGAVIARLAVAGRPGDERPAGEDVVDGDGNGHHNSNGGADDDRDHGGGGGRPRRYSPVVTRMAAAHQLDLSEVAGTGARGRVTKQDVRAHLARAEEERPLHSESPYRPEPEPPSEPAAGPAPVAADAPAAARTDLGGTSAPLSRMRQAIGAAMLRSQQTAATCHTVVECDMSRVEKARREQGLTALPFVARAVVQTLGAFPELNATLDGTTLTRYARVHLGIAVSLGADGLIVPVVRDAQDLSEAGLAARVKDLARRARAGELAPDDVQGATFTITNPGAAGALLATPIIAVPQVAILDLEAVVRRPVVVADAEGNESIAIRPMANLILGWDHRALDGIYAAQFLTALRRRLESAG